MFDSTVKTSQFYILHSFESENSRVRFYSPLNYTQVSAPYSYGVHREEILKDSGPPLKRKYSLTQNDWL